MRHQIMDVTLYLERTATKYVNNLCIDLSSKSSENPANIYLFKVDNKILEKGMKNMFKFDNKNTRTTSLTSFWCFYC